jgi:hypothetical protein
MTSPPIRINNPEHGFLDIGEETDNKVQRKHHVQLGGGTGAALHIYSDGGWALVSKTNSKGSNLIQEGTGPINIVSDGDINIEAGGTLSLRAKDIVMETLSAEGDIVMNAKRNIKIDADNNVNILGTNIKAKSAHNLLLHSEGWAVLSGNPVSSYERKTKLIPTSFRDLIETLIGEV